MISRLSMLRLEAWSDFRVFPLSPLVNCLVMYVLSLTGGVLLPFLVSFQQDSIPPLITVLILCADVLVALFYFRLCPCATGPVDPSFSSWG